MLNTIGGGGGGGVKVVVLLLLPFCLVVGKRELISFFYSSHAATQGRIQGGLRGGHIPLPPVKLNQ
jgi:hypothetical protein